MDLDDILSLAEAREPSPLEFARARRVARNMRGAYDVSRAEGYEIIVDNDPTDPLTSKRDEVTRIERAAQLAKCGTITWTDGALKWSDRMAMIFGYAPGALALTSEALTRLVHPADARTVREAVRTAWEWCRPAEVTFRAIHPNGSIRHVHCHIEILTTAGEPTGIIATGEDVTALELERQERRRLATRSRMLCPDAAAKDLITGLPARGYFTDEVDRARRTADGALIVVATEPTTRLSRTMSDQDHEDLTSAVAGLLRTVAGPDLTCGLAGPGLWGVLTGGPHVSPDETDALALRMVSTLRSHLFKVQPATVRLNASAGVVHFARGVSATGSDLLVDGEHAAREAGRQGIAVEVLDRPVPDEQRTGRCRSRVQYAVAKNRFALYAQPIVDLALNQVTRHEILLRVRGDTGDLIAPWAFLDMAERVGEILAVDKWVIDHALELIGQGAQTTHYQINLSGRSLADPGLLTYVTEAIRRNGVKPEGLTFEITETALIENRNEALAFATGIREIGCRLALDDFGTGYAALAYLKYLPVDLVKIDGVFIVDICRSPADRAVVSQLVNLCHTFGIRVAAECVQDEETITLLREYGVDFIQGYRTGRPAPIAASLKPEANTVELEIWLPQQRTAIG